jgi:hypothetical protein
MPLVNDFYTLNKKPNNDFKVHFLDYNTTKYNSSNKPLSLDNSNFNNVIENVTPQENLCPLGIENHFNTSSSEPLEIKAP